ncbi:MAG: hypothetical protein VZR54_09925 [Ruminococcus sp.]|nr:hypothetical protein [Ruminococcus sp.]
MFDSEPKQPSANPSYAVTELKIGKIVQIVLRELLESGKVEDAEIINLQDKNYCKMTFALNFPMLVNWDGEYNKVRYYVDPVSINGEKFALCSQWIERERPLLLNWIESHK